MEQTTPQIKEEQNKFVRQTAIKTTIQEISHSTFINTDPETPHHIQTLHHGKVFRVNLIGIIIQKEKVGSITNMLIEDQTGQMVLRSFEELHYLKNVKVGDFVLVIGKVRMYNNEKYVSPEIMKVTSPLWLKVRMLELREMVELDKEIIPIVKEDKIEVTIEDPIEEEISDESKEQEKLLPVEKITKLIKDLDQGEGVLIEDIIEKSILDDTEKLIEKMMESGDIFQNQPGRVKVL
jgi:RPA family protein